MDYFIQLLTAFGGSLGFSLVFNIRNRFRLFFAGLGGVISWGIYLIFFSLIGGEIISYFIASVAFTFYAEVLARYYKTPATLFLVSSAIPLIPGGSLYKTMSFAIGYEWSRFFQQGLLTLMLAAAIAVGILFAMGLWNFVMKVISAVETSLKKEKSE